MILAREKSLNERLQLALRHHERFNAGRGFGEAVAVLSDAPVTDQVAAEFLKSLATGDDEARTRVVKAITDR